MYRIRSGSGAEAVYNSLEEFTAAVRRGAVNPADEIFHLRANRWLDVKSHPHYRLAIAGGGHADTPAAPAAPRPAPTQPADRPSLRPQQTVMGPRLVPTQRPVQKSGELTFIPGAETAPASQRNVTVMEARKAPAPPPSASATRSQFKPGANAAPSATEAEFLVMDGGIESPVRTSQGQRTIPEDLDLLFDAPLHPPKDSASLPVAVVPAPTRSQVPTATPQPVAKPAAPAVEARPAAPAKPESPKIEAPKAAIAAPVLAPPKIQSKPAPVAPPAAATLKAAPVKPAATVKPAVAEDMTIPGAAILEARPDDIPVAVVAPHASPAPAGRSVGGLAGVGLAVILVVGGLLAWKPWSARGPAAHIAEASSPSETASAEATQAPVVSMPGAPATNESSAKPSGPAAPTTKSPESGTKPDSGTVKPADDQVIVAARTNFKADMSVPTGDLGLGTDIRTATVSGSIVAPTELVSRLEAAEKLAQLELGTKLGGFRTLLAPNRLSTPDGVNAARTAWTGGAEMIRQYRARILRMEKAYEDSVLTSQRSQRWSGQEMRAWAGHQSQAEPVETSQLADLMFSQVNEGLDILAALAGQYEIKGGLVTFKNPASGIRYTSIRTWVDQRMQAWAGTPENARANSVSAILRALGDGFPAAK